MTAVARIRQDAAANNRRVISFYSRPRTRGLRRDLAPLSIHLGLWDGATTSHAAAAANMDRALVGRVGLRSGERVLDAGCGFGSSAARLAREVGAEVVGVDLVPSQIYYAHRLARRRGLSHLLSFELANFTATPFTDGSFDVVWAVESVCHTPDKIGFLAEARRLLEPGGRLVVADLFRTARPCEPAGEELLRRWHAGWAIPDLATVEEFETAAREAGFGEVRREDVTANVYPSLARIHHRALAVYPVVSLARRIGLPAGPLLARLRSDVDQFRALGRGLWSYSIFTARAG
jgi:tocopherol O-methyltransferase